MHRLSRFSTRQDFGRLLLFFALFLLFFGSFFIRLDPDFGWHLAAGRYFMANWLPSHDIFTYTQVSHVYISHEWIHDILVAFLYNIGGYALLAAFFAGLWTLTLWIVGRKADWRLIVLASIAVSYFAGVRTITWSALFFVILIAIVSRKSSRLLFVIPPFFALWANIHGSFTLGLLFLVFCSVVQKSWRLGVVTLVSAAATLINPYGARLYEEVVEILTDTNLHGTITEWHSFALPLIIMPYCIVWGFGVAWQLFGEKKWRDWHTYLSFDFILLAMSISSQRNCVLFVLGTIPSTIERFAPIIAQLKGAPADKRRLAEKVSTVVVALSAVILSIITYHGYSLDRERNYPSQEVAYLTEHPCDGNVFNAYNYGGYLIWKLPGQKVYIDGRSPSWRRPDGTRYLDTYFKVLNDKKTREKEFSKYHIRCVIAESDSPIVKQLLKEKWRRVITGQDSVLLLSPTPVT